MPTKHAPIARPDPVEMLGRFYPEHIAQTAGKPDQINECAGCGQDTPPGKRLCHDCELTAAAGEL